MVRELTWLVKENRMRGGFQFVEERSGSPPFHGCKFRGEWPNEKWPNLASNARGDGVLEILESENQTPEDDALDRSFDQQVNPEVVQLSKTASNITFTLFQNSALEPKLKIDSDSSEGDFAHRVFHAGGA